MLAILTKLYISMNPEITIYIIGVYKLDIYKVITNFNF
jgi:hypothetical protein